MVTNTITPLRVFWCGRAYHKTEWEYRGHLDRMLIHGIYHEFIWYDIPRRSDLSIWMMRINIRKLVKGYQTHTNKANILENNWYMLAPSTIKNSWRETLILLEMHHHHRCHSLSSTHVKGRQLKWQWTLDISPGSHFSRVTWSKADCATEISGNSWQNRWRSSGGKATGNICRPAQASTNQIASPGMRNGA